MLPNILAICLFFLTPILYASTNSSPLPSFETSWLESTAGTGVGSLLMDESTILNPAPLAFFNISSLYFQKTKNKGVSSANQTAFIVSDTGKGVPASLSYIATEKDESNKREQYSVSFAYPVKKRSSFGVGYRLTKERIASGEYRGKHRNKQVVLGIIHVPAPSFSFGLVLVDPFKKNNDHSRGTLGLQYVYDSFFSLLFDVESHLTSDFSDSMTYKSAIQLKIMSDLFFRMGAFQNNKTNQKGMGAGMGWIQPRLSLNLGLKNTRLPSSLEKNVKTSFSLSYRF